MGNTQNSHYEVFISYLHRADKGVFTDEDLAYFEGCACEVHPNGNDHRERSMTFT